MKKTAEDILASYVDALRPIIYINHFDSTVIDEIIRRIGQGVKIVEYNNALGIIDFNCKSPLHECSLVDFLKLVMDDGFDQSTFIVLKDIHEKIHDQNVISLLKRIAENTLHNDKYECTVFVVAPKTVIPAELENYITVFDIPLPTDEEILAIIRSFISDLEIEVSDDVINDIRYPSKD